jgi:hypothetical protein
MKNIITKLKNFFKRFDLINSWRNGMGSKQGDKYLIEFRLGKLTIFELDIDFSKSFRITLFNFAISFK